MIAICIKINIFFLRIRKDNSYSIIYLIISFLNSLMIKSQSISLINENEEKRFYVSIEEGLVTSKNHWTIRGPSESSYTF
jgi:hypothetical protein